MIKLILSGGLGNQMFQYATAKALSLKLECPLAVDLSMFHKKTKSTKRDYELGIFDLDLKITKSIRAQLCIRGYKYLRSSDSLRQLFRLINLFYEPRPDFYNKRFETLTDGTILLGYFHNEKYFEDYSSQIRKDFSFIKELSGDNLLIKQQIQTSNSVSIHIRRGDYLNPQGNLEVLDLAYYLNAIDYLKDRIENPTFFIFSDDIDWVKKNLALHDFVHIYVDNNKGESSYIDMQLISCCKHNIMANSTFSWWGAWLNDNPSKLVIAPSVWYKNVRRGNYIDGYIPQTWIII